MVHPDSTSPSMGDSTIGGDPASTIHGSGPGSSSGAGSFATLPQPGARFGRFEIVRQLGAGAMGVVMLARDVDLARAVAIKFLSRTGADEAANQRLLREAQAVARLQHPNVVAVHEVGHAGTQVFVVMEYVDGGTLRQWCAAAPRQWHEIVEVYVQAALGLEAAHAAGLVHRDFKPDNALIGSDGRVRVSDFGLVGGSIGEAAFTGGDPQDVTLTRTGAVLGTPAYMAPEQFAGADVGPAADQFALCVALFEALYGARPFAGGHFMEILDAIESGTVRSQTRADIPSPIHGAIVRGFAKRPELRHPSMGALARALRWRPVAATAKTAPGLVIAIVAVVVVLLVVAAGIAWWARRGDPPIDAPNAASTTPAAGVDPAAWPCAGAPPSASWNDERRAAITDAFVKTGSPFAADQARHTTAAIDAYAVALDRVAEDLCAAPPDAKVHARVVACLGNGVDALDGSFDALTKDATVEVVEGALSIAAGLPSPTRCGDADSVLADGTPPVQTREQLAPPRRAVWYAFARLQANDLVRADAMLAATNDAIAALDSTPLDLQHALVRARIATARGDGVGAEGAYREALAHARAASDTTMQTILLADLAQTNATALGRIADADAIAGQMRELMPRASLDIRWYGHGALASLAMAKGDLVLGETELSAEIDGLAALKWPRPIAIASIRMVRANVRAQLGRKDEALADARQSLEESALAGGARTILHATLLTELSMIHMIRGERDDARARLAEARSTLEVASPSAKAMLSESLLRFADLERQIGDYDSAARLLGDAAQLANEANEPERVARISIELAMTELLRGRFDDAAARVEAAVEIAGRFPQSRHIDGLRLVEIRAGVAWARADYPEAIALTTQRIALIEARFGPMTAAAAAARVNLVEMYASREDCTQVTAELARALRVRETLGMAPDLDLVRLLGAQATCAIRDEGEIATARELMQQMRLVPEAVAPAVVVTPRLAMLEAEIAFAQENQAEARAHAKRAREAYAAMGTAWSVQAREIDLWIDENLDEEEVAPAVQGH